MTMEDSLPVAVASAPKGESSNEHILTAAKGGGVLFVGRLVEYASRFAFGIIVARILGADGYGLYTLGVATAIMLASVARLGLSEGLVHFLPAALSRRDDARTWGILQAGLIGSTVLGLGFGMLLFALAEPLATNLFHDPAAARVLRLVSISVPVMALGRVLLAAIRGFQTMRYEVYVDSIALSVARLGLTALLLALGWGLPGALAAHVLAWIAADALLFFFLNRLFPLRRGLGGARCDVRRVLSYSVPLCLTQLIRQLRGNFDLLLLGILTTMAAVGVYSAAARVQMVGGMFLMAAEMVAKPIIADLYHKGDVVQLGRLYKTLTRWSFVFVMPYFLTILVFAKPILAIFGEEFAEGGQVLMIVSIGTLVQGATGICDATIVMTGHSRLTFLNSLIAAGLSVGLALILIPARGLLGAAIAASLSLTLTNILGLIQVYWLHRLWPYDRELVKPLLASGVALAVGCFMNERWPAEQSIFYLLTGITLFWLTYVAVIILLGLSTEDCIVLCQTRRRFASVLAGVQRNTIG